uniref:Large ribosomal subunit protein mL54 n=1 Tax=Chromera velia CCMP2878 TaxID=1169474 RepID=A0A0G4GSG9_9ALVE|mmetsp:Transcript_28849/g.56516  ORF Transcript_28849/g.56516 Transcript_28849/m.56516 type:complete len:145 (+) Transcript_28849:272-706(+)|eukprot:Cvel_5148.t1-p1 / transcript=Cvel_5148.t1 / gene=Cvel_5148 / organism=Chromera_velia_CCMP2878 / gene_product=hypothetical protein / transcript_product=hypothetical protein / location=Cvel_scaffold235:101479-104521(-) / protein_length=144 / sequence_SO=supercontig / SO=protein_coding / is_pseudo=false
MLRQAATFSRLPSPLSPLSKVSVRHCIFLSRILVGPKGKKGAQAAAPEKPKAAGSNHIFNIFAEQEDHRILPDEFYPKWLYNLALPEKRYGELCQNFIHGKDIKNVTQREYRRFRKHHTRYLIKLNNMRLMKRRKVNMPLFWDV